MTRACDQRQIRPLFAAATILSVFLAACLFMGTPLVNAQTEESTTLEERIARIEGTLEQMNERLLELNHLGDRLDSIHSEINVLNINIGERIDRLHSENITLLIAMLSTIILSPVSQALAKRYIDRDA